jgi:hypothetical protein
MNVRYFRSVAGAQYCRLAGHDEYRAGVFECDAGVFVVLSVGSTATVRLRLVINAPSFSYGLCAPDVSFTSVQRAGTRLRRLENCSYLNLAERVGFAPLPVAENKELKGFPLPHDPRDPVEDRGRDTY